MVFPPFRFSTSTRRRPCERGHRVHREFFKNHPEKFDLRDPGKVFMPEYAKFIAAKNVLLGSAGQVDDARAFIQAHKK